MLTDATRRSNLLSSLSQVTREIEDTKKKLNDLREREAKFCKQLGIRPSEEKGRTRMTKEKAQVIRVHVIESLSKLRERGMEWISMTTLARYTHQRFEEATEKEIKGQIRAMAGEEIIEHNGIRGYASSYRLGKKIEQ